MTVIRLTVYNDNADDKVGVDVDNENNDNDNDEDGWYGNGSGPPGENRPGVQQTLTIEITFKLYTIEIGLVKWSYYSQSSLTRGNYWKNLKCLVCMLSDA